MQAAIVDSVKFLLARAANTSTRQADHNQAQDLLARINEAEHESQKDRKPEKQNPAAAAGPPTPDSRATATKDPPLKGQPT